MVKADSITLETSTVTNIGLGKGHDHLSATSITLGTAATINLGEGRDTIVIEDMAVTLSAGSHGDAAGGTNYGADSIFIDGLQSAATVKGQGGDDTITLVVMQLMSSSSTAVVRTTSSPSPVTKTTSPLAVDRAQTRSTSKKATQLLLSSMVVMVLTAFTSTSQLPTTIWP